LNLLFRIIFIGILFFSCSCESKQIPENSSIEIAETFHQAIHFDSITLLPNKGIYVFQNIPFSGVAFSYYPNSTQFSRKIEFKKGKKNGLFELYFIDGQLSQQLNYLNGRRDGIAKTWWKNGQLRSQSNFKNDKGHGVQQQWYKDGMIFKKLNLEEGKEVGLQQAWRKNGALYANYEARNGRIYGMKKANLCFELSDEELKSSTIVSEEKTKNKPYESID